MSSHDLGSATLLNNDLIGGAGGTPAGAREDLRASSTSDALQLLTASGERAHVPQLDGFVDDLDDDDLRALFRDMVIVRRIDTEGTALQRQGQLGLWPPLLGQEAAQVGSARALGPRDFVFSSYRENAVAWCRGVPAAGLMPVWRGTASTGWNPYDHGMATPQVIIGAQTLHAVGWALGALYDDEDAAAICYFGDGATSQGDVSEAMVFAASTGAPVVFFCQNNQWAISEPVTLQAKRRIADRAPGYGIPSLRVDGNDVLAVLAASRAALERARSGGGPSFIEAVTYRMGAHTTADDPTRYRADDELTLWAAKDPIDRMATWLRTRGVLTPAREAEVAAEADRVAAEVRAACLALEDPDPLSLFDHVYAEEHPVIEREREAYRRYLAMFDDAPAERA